MSESGELSVILLDNFQYSLLNSLMGNIGGFNSRHPRLIKLDYDSISRCWVLPGFLYDLKLPPQLAGADCSKRKYHVLSAKVIALFLNAVVYRNAFPNL